LRLVLGLGSVLRLACRYLHWIDSNRNIDPNLNLDPSVPVYLLALLNECATAVAQIVCYAQYGRPSPANRVRVRTVNSFFSRRMKSEKRKTTVFRFPYAERKSTHGFPYRFSHSCRMRKTKNEMCIAFSMYDRQYENRNTVCEKRIFVNIVFCVSHLARNEKNKKRSVYVPLVRFSHFVRYKENEKRHLEPFFSFRIKKEKRNTAIRFVLRFSYFSLQNEKNEWRHCRFSSFALPEIGIRKMDRDVMYSVALLLRFFVKSYGSVLLLL